MKYALGNMLNGAGGLNPDGLSLDLQFAADKTLTARKGPTPVFTRASSGTFVGSDGLIQSAGNNEPRFDHDPVTLACKGLLIEESRTNLLTNSNFVGWSSGGSITVTPNSVDVGVAPDGSYPTKIECAVTGNFQLGIPVISGVTYNNSVYARSLSGGVNIRIGGIISGVVSTFNTTNQFARYSHVNTAAATTTRFLLIAMNAGETIYVWGAQAEAGAFPTSYIPTTTSALARSADVCSITGTNFTGMYNQPEGTLFADARVETAARSANGFLASLYGAVNTEFALRIFGIGNQVIVRDGTARDFTVGVNATNMKVAAAYSSLNNVASMNGGGIATGTAYSLPAMTALSIGLRTGNTQQVNGTISAIRYYKKRLSNQKIQALTA